MASYEDIDPEIEKLRSLRRKYELLQQEEHKEMAGKQKATGTRVWEATERHRPNDMVLGAHRYNTDKIDPMDEITSSLESFIASDDSVDDSSQSQTQESNEGSQGSVISRPSQQSSYNQFNNGLNTPRRRYHERVSSDDEENGSQDEENCEPNPANAAARSSTNDEHDSERFSYDQANNGLAIIDTPRRRARDRINSDEETDGESTPCKRSPSRKDTVENDDLENSPRKRSARVVASSEAKKSARETIFGPLKQDRESKKARLEDTGEKALEEGAEKQDEADKTAAPTATSTTPKPESPDKRFSPIESLASVPDGAMVNVRGVVVSCGQDDTRPVYSGSQKRVPIRKIFVEDDSGTVEVTLWRNYASDEKIQEGACVTICGLKKTTFRDEPQLATYRSDTLIQTVEAPKKATPVAATPASPSRRWYVIEDVNPNLTHVYRACANCYFSKIHPTYDEKYICSKCRKSYDPEDTDVGIAMGIMIRDEHDEYILQKIFTPSVRKLCPEVPQKWGHSGDDLKVEIVRLVQETLPKQAFCRENASDNLEILQVDDDGDGSGED